MQAKGRSDRRIEEFLADYDEALAEGRVPASLAFGLPDGAEDDLAELRANQRILQLMELVWPRKGNSVSSLERHVQAVAMAIELQTAYQGPPLSVRSIATLEDLQRTLATGDVVSPEDLETSLADLPQEQRPRSASQLLYELVARGLLDSRQAMHLGSGQLERLVLGDYLILAELGRGGMGVVYKALDRKRDVRVALKTLLKTDAGAILRLKHEFRSLANLVHDNLAILEELCSVDGRWFFTMEFVEGQHFTDYVRGVPFDAPPVPSAVTESFLELRQPDAKPPAAPPPVPGAIDSRLRESLRQLGAGLSVLHANGKLHRDVKPSNVLVTPEGRVVLVDFGMAVDLELGLSDGSDQRQVAGTLPYMSPEQSTGQPLTPASDWYSTGVMLYETLTGERPFAGTFQEMLEAKRRGPPPLPEDLVSAGLADLVELCQQLLHPDPGHRPKGEEILRRLRGKPPSRIAAARRETPAVEGLFVVRKAELSQLNQAFADVEAGRPVSVHIDGPAGIGKTALVNRFLEQFEAREDVLVLRGRCYERESVPYKALDGIVDALGLHLRAIPCAQIEGVLPPRVRCLVRAFPVLGQIRSLIDRSKSETIPLERREVRRDAVDSLRELLARLAGIRPTSVLVDDLQWGDADSAVLLNELFASGDSPALLFIGCYRSEDVQSSPCLKALVKTPPGPDAGPERRQVTVTPLSPEESRHLAATLSERAAVSPVDWVADVSRESQGHPYFLIELAQQLPDEASAVGEAHGSLPLDLDAVLLGRVRRLPEAARELLNVVAIAGRPLGMEEACRAIQSTPDPRIAAMLQSDHLIRNPGGERNRVETYHDRIRETITRHLSAERRRGYHARLAATLEASAKADPELLCVHFQEAGEHEKAGRYALVAADRAADALAFDRAAGLYQFVLDLGFPAASHEPELRKKLADALANAGHAIEASKHYLAAAGETAGIEAVELRRLAADQLLRTGHIPEGKKAMAEALAGVGLRLPKSSRHAILIILVERLRLWLRGKRFRERQEAQIPRQQLVQLDTCWSAATSLGMVEALTGAAFGFRYLLLVRKAGEPSRIALTLASEAQMHAMIAGRQNANDERLFETAERMAKCHNNPHVNGFIKLAKGRVDSFLGHWRRGLRMCDEAEDTLRQHCAGAYWEISMISVDVIASLFFLGELKELSRRIPKIIRDAEERQDLFAGFAPRTYFGNVVWLAADQVDEARRQADLAMEGWPREPFLLQHVFELIGSASIDLYAGDGPRAWDRIAEAWPDFKRSWHAKHRFARILIWHLRARAALASLGHGLNDALLIRSAERDAKKILREPTSWSRPLARLIRAGVAVARDQEAQAVDQLETSIRELDAGETALFSAAAKRRLGELLQGDEGASLLVEGTSFMTDEGVQSPDRMTAMLAPGFDR
jgi:serine/threonine protein kinase